MFGDKGLGRKMTLLFKSVFNLSQPDEKGKGVGWREGLTGKGSPFCWKEKRLVNYIGITCQPQPLRNLEFK